MFADRADLESPPRLLLISPLPVHPGSPLQAQGSLRTGLGTLSPAVLGMGPGLCELKELHTIKASPDLTEPRRWGSKRAQPLPQV